MADNEFLGSSLYATWTTSSGTTTLNTEFRNFTYRPSIDIIDATAGADSNRRRITYLKDGQVTVTQLMQNDLGSATMAQLAEGMSGTLLWAEVGTATGKPKHTMAAICLGSSYTTPY